MAKRRILHESIRQIFMKHIEPCNDWLATRETLEKRSRKVERNESFVPDKICSTDSLEQ